MGLRSRWLRQQTWTLPCMWTTSRGVSCGRLCRQLLPPALALQPRSAGSTIPSGGSQDKRCRQTLLPQRPSQLQRRVPQGLCGRDVRGSLPATDAAVPSASGGGNRTDSPTTRRQHKLTCGACALRSVRGAAFCKCVHQCVAQRLGSWTRCNHPCNRYGQAHGF